MTNQAVVVVGCRVFGLYLLIRILPSVPQAANLVLSGIALDFAAIILPVALNLILSTVLILFPGGLARMLLVGSNELERQDSNWQPAELQAVLTFALGLLLVCWTLSDAQILLQALLALAMFFDAGNEAPPAGVAAFWSILIRLVAGITLMLGTRGITSFIRRLRQAGT